MKNIITYTATEAREKLFEILNSVYYGNKEVRIIKNKRAMVKIIKADNDQKEGLSNFLKLAGTMPDKDAKAMKKSIRELKKLPARAHEVLFD